MTRVVALALQAKSFTQSLDKKSYHFYLTKGKVFTIKKTELAVSKLHKLYRIIKSFV